MIKIILTASAVLWMALATFSQGARYNIRGAYDRAVTGQQLGRAQSLSDIFPYYPSSWIENYGSVQIQAMHNGKPLMAKSRSERLSAEQKKLLLAADLGCDVIIDVLYSNKNPITDILENHTIHMVFTVIPESEARYSGGTEALNRYFREKGLDNTAGTSSWDIVVGFTIGEAGNIIGTHIKNSSGDFGKDQFFINMINQQPRWKPAENGQGIKVKQNFEFEYIVGTRAGC